MELEFRTLRCINRVFCIVAPCMIQGEFGFLENDFDC